MGVVQRLKNTLLSKKVTEQELFLFIKKSLTIDDKMSFIGEFLKLTAHKCPKNIALISGLRSIDYQELYFRASLLSKKLKSNGVRPHDKVLMLFENSIEFYIVYFAILQLGAVCVPLNVFLHEKELAYIIKDSSPVAIVSSRSFKHKIEVVKALSEGDEFPSIFGDENIDFKKDVPKTLEEIDALFTMPRPNLDTLCLLLYTSGTTGVPKGVMLSSNNIVTNAIQCAARLEGYNKIRGLLAGEKLIFKERFFAALPLFHVFAQNTCIWFPMMVGGTVIIVPRIDRKELLLGLEHKPTLFFGVPALFGLLCLMKTAPLDSVRFFVSGGDATPDKIRSAFSMIYGRKICSGYGLTEASPVISVNIDNDECEAHVVGVPLHGIDVDIRNDQGESLPHGGIGTLWVRGDNIMLGYYKSKQETDSVLQSGWLNTGDIASFDAKTGRISIRGRIKDLIINKGLNIYPQEVENVLLSHPVIFQAAVIGREDTTAGQVPIAFVSLKDDKVKADDVDRILRDFCSNHLAGYKIPRKFVYLDSLPMNQTGKVDKKQLLAD
jgi:long-chain acyl-CoA synthetase